MNYVEDLEALSISARPRRTTCIEASHWSILHSESLCFSCSSPLFWALFTDSYKTSGQDSMTVPLLCQFGRESRAEARLVGGRHRTKKSRDVNGATYSCIHKTEAPKGRAHRRGREGRGRRFCRTISVCTSSHLGRSDGKVEPLCVLYRSYSLRLVSMTQALAGDRSLATSDQAQA